MKRTVEDVKQIHRKLKYLVEERNTISQHMHNATQYINDAEKKALYKKPFIITDVDEMQEKFYLFNVIFQSILNLSILTMEDVNIITLKQTWPKWKNHLELTQGIYKDIKEMSKTNKPIPLEKSYKQTCDDCLFNKTTGFVLKNLNWKYFTKIRSTEDMKY